MVNYKFRKRPIIIEAFQMTLARRWDNHEWPNWLHAAWNKPIYTEGAVWIDPEDGSNNRLTIGTKEGTYRLSWGDWLILGIAGEIYACKPDIFELTYEPEPDDV